MSRRTRYAVDPSLLSAQSPSQQPVSSRSDPSSGFSQAGWVQQGEVGYGSQPLENTQYGLYNPAAAAQPRERSWAGELPSPPVQAPVQQQPIFGYDDQHAPQQQGSYYQEIQQNHPSTSGAIHPSIAPLPHAPGPSLRGPKPKINPEQIPSQVEAAELDQNLFDESDFRSQNPRGVIPTGTTDYRGVDEGNSLPRYIRATLCHTPSTAAVLDTSQLPFGLVVQPFATPRYDEVPIPYVEDFKTAEGDEDGGPPRCVKCRGYVNPWVRWTEGGKKWACNLCGNLNSVPESYFSHLDSYGNRLDIESRPELKYGTVDFPVPPSYWAANPSSILDASGLSTTGSDLLASLNQAVAATSGSNLAGQDLKQKQKEQAKRKEQENARAPAPIGRVFAIDVSWNAARSGMIAEVCEGIRQALYGTPEELTDLEGDSDGKEDAVPAGPPRAEGRIAIMTFNREVHYYSLSAGQEKPLIMVVSDLEDMFVPLMEGFLVDPYASRRQIEQLLDMLPQIYAEPYTEIALGACIKGALAGLAHRGGQLTIFLSALPNVGPGVLNAREDPLIMGTDKERTLYGPADAFWSNTAESLAEAGVGTNVFFFPERYIDVASVGTLAAVTGGNLFYHPRFDSVRDRSRLHASISRVVRDPIAYNCMVRIRCSSGLRVSSHVGNFHQRNNTDLEFGTLDNQQAFVGLLKHDSHLDEKATSFFQVATLYTSASGERRVRTLNLSLPITNHIGNLFRFADLDSTVTLLLKEAVSQASLRGLSGIRKNLTERCIKILSMYRKHCSSPKNTGQLVLPETLPLLPLFVLCIIKCKALKGGHVSPDVRSTYMRTLRSMPLPQSMAFLYPRMMPLHDMAENAGYVGSNGRLVMPRFLRDSYAYMTADGAYMIMNGEIAIIWLGQAVSPQILNDLYGVENLDELDVRMTSLPKLPSYLSTQVRNILAHFERLYHKKLPVVIARQNIDGTETEFANMLVEDSNNDALSYVEYLMSLHRSITEEISGDRGKGESWKTPWS